MGTVELATCVDLRGCRICIRDVEDSRGEGFCWHLENWLYAGLFKAGNSSQCLRGIGGASLEFSFI